MDKKEIFRRALVMINNKHLQAAAVLIVFLVVFYQDVVFYNRTFLIETAAQGTMPDAGPYQYRGIAPAFVANDPGAIAWQIEPFNRFISKSVKNGDFPLWNPYAGLAGNPLLADGHTGPLEPLQFLFFFFPARFWPYAIDLQLLIRFFISGFGCYLLARRLKVDFLSSIASGALFMFSSYFVTYGNHPQIKTEALLPLVVYGYDRLADLKDGRGFWYSALIIGWAIIAAMPEATFFSLFLGTLWFFYSSFLHWRENRGSNIIKSTLLRYFGSTILGFLISAAYLLPFLEYVSISHHVHSGNYAGVSLPLWSLPNLLFQVQGTPYLQLGFFALFSLIYLLIGLKDFPSQRKNVIFFGSYAVIILLTIFDFPLTNWIRQLPALNQLLFQKYAVPSIVFCLAILAGILIDGLKHTYLSYKKISLSLLILFAAVIGLPILGNPSKSLSFYFTDSQSMYSSFGLIAGISIAVCLLTYLYIHRDVSMRIMQAGFLILVVWGPFYWEGRITRPDRVDPFRSPPFVDYVRDDKEFFRILGLNGILFPNISTAYGISDIRWLNALIPQRTFDFSIRFLTPTEPKTMRFTGTRLPIFEDVLDILGVKYVLTKNREVENVEHCPSDSDKRQDDPDQPYFGEDTLNKLILQQNTGNLNLREESLNIDGIAKMAIFAHPPQTFDLALSIPRSPSELEFSIGLNPEVFRPDRGDGVKFQIVLVDGKNELDIFSKYIDPKSNSYDRLWSDEIINLSQWAGKDVVFKFSTEAGPMGDSSWDWAYWGNIQLTTPFHSDETEAEPVSAQYYSLVYEDKNVLIYQNEDVFPRAFVVYSVNNVSTFKSAMDQLADPQLDLRQTAIVENLPEEIENKINQNDRLQSVAGNAKLVSSGRLDVEVDTEAPGLLVVTDQYYPGWKAYVDGKPTPIYAVNGTFRGIFLDAGNHMVEFKYRPLSFTIGGIVSATSLLITLFFVLYYSRPSQKHHE